LDGIVDRLDRCPREAEDKDDFRDQDGCPDPDNDGDGVLDADDRCPSDPGPAENQGCPDRDRDKDGIIDRLDNCPDEPGEAANNGCKRPQLARLTARGIEIVDTVYFETDKAVIQRKSFPLLDNVAAVIGAHPEIEVLRVEGHTDAQGDDAHNQKLSERRAAAVAAYLTKKGIDSGRLNPRGYGETQPIADNKTRGGRAQNRRVVFVIERSGAGD
jgi:outer membrane protein OmpA-like peptidoglycan-associated protein